MILGMDWLSHHQAMEDYQLKRITLQIAYGDEMTVVGEGMGCLSSIISTMTVRRLIRKGCEGFLAHVIDTRETNSSLHDIPIVCDFSNVFSEELLGLLPKREVEFAIEIMWGTTLIFVSPYRMAPTELKELNVQL